MVTPYIINCDIVYAHVPHAILYPYMHADADHPWHTYSSLLLSVSSHCTDHDHDFRSLIARIQIRTKDKTITMKQTNAATVSAIPSPVRRVTEGKFNAIVE